MKRVVIGIVWLSVAAPWMGCDEPVKSTDAKPSATATTPPPPPPKPKDPNALPDLTVDELGPYLGGERARLSEAGGPEKLKKVIAALPINGRQVTLVVLKKAKTPDVVATVTELGNAGAPTVLVHTDGRDDLPKEIVVTPGGKVSKPTGCTVAAMVLDDLSTAVWPFAGGTGKKHRKGFAGPDLSHTAESLKKDIEKCNSNIAFFSADDSLPWEMAHNLAGTVLGSDENKKIDTLVLLPVTPVAGRPVEQF